MCHGLLTVNELLNRVLVCMHSNLEGISGYFGAALTLLLGHTLDFLEDKKATKMNGLLTFNKLFLSFSLGYLGRIPKKHCVAVCLVRGAPILLINVLIND